MSTTINDERRSLAPPRGLATALDWATTSHKRAAVLLLAFALLAFIPGFFQIPAVDRDEARFAQATKQMLESGDYVDIRFQDEVRYKKPVGIYWLQSAAVKVGSALGVSEAHTTIWLYRLPSLFGAIGAVLLTYWVALAFVARRSALVAALMMASAVLLGVEARLAKTDAVLLFTSVLAMGAMARIYLNERRTPEKPVGWQMPGLMWTAIAAGALVKGPLVLMFVVLTAGALSIVDRSARWLWKLKPIAGFIWMLLLVSPWFIAIALKSGESFFVQAVGQDMLSKVTSGQEAHGAPPGYYFLLFWVTFWPGSVLAGLAAPTVWRARKEPGAQFLLAWLVPSWIVFEVVMTKLPHYVLPLYPAIAILIAGILERDALAKKPWMVRGTVGWFLFPAVIAVAVVAIFIVFGRDLGLAAWPSAAVAAILGLFAWWLYDVDGAERALLRGMVASVFVAFTVYAVTFPLLPMLFPSAVIARELHAAGCENPHVASTYAYQEPSLVFSVGTDTRFTDGAGAAEFLRQGACHFALVDPRSERSFVQRANAIGLRYALSQRIEGFNISIGKPVVLTIFRSMETP
ncbi:glycosyltransferase family 39 protein [Pseudolabrys taiwanensis]|uniref:Glycosyltransferase family 39 protein n=1 Tax=Pseudolabrys taiwanensis TaxID=331696 RepID=A0A345ZS98_9HYPH|nr:glycosyltransferase family 39 protein [Pseudolabrys taiwanensis]AXK79795.1 glycosyltransferase family 39 protein [Pseudolabrys taiwanensis]